ncbi:MAG: alpha/beta hydrolase [Chloroflexi bacterium]|nr:alpha/beta hydrolase [Chloroflexota bacterium]
MNKDSQSRHKKRGYLWWLVRILLGFVALLLIVLSITLLAGAKAKSDLKAKYPPPGAMVDVGGYRLHIFCEGRGSPTVIMESGLGDPSLLWELVRLGVVKTTRTCVYDRAGLGWSDLSPKPRTAENIVEELHTLLTNAGVAGPYVLVGHSIGGMYVRLYAHKYPESVVGMVLVDSSHEEQYLRFPAAAVKFSEQYAQQLEQQLKSLKPLAAMGFMALSPASVPVSDKLPKVTRETYQALFAMDTKSLETIIAEQKVSESNLVQVGAARITTMGNIPLIVLSAGQSELAPSANISPAVIQQEEQVWQQLQIELTMLSPQGKQVVASQSGHYIQLEQPQLVIDAIVQVAADARK